MSFITGTNVELIYASTAAGIARNTFTAEAVLNDEATMGPQARLPADFWLPSKTSLGRGIRIVARGILSSTVTPTYTFTIRFAATAAATTGTIVLGSAALTTASGTANTYWEIDGDIIMEAIGTTAGSSTVRGIARCSAAGITTGAGVNPLYGGAASPGTVATVDRTAVNFVTVNVACSASSSSNTITLQQLLIYGLN